LKDLFDILQTFLLIAVLIAAALLIARAVMG
jgi:hypothetical protein